MFIKTERKTNTLANGETKEYTNIKIVDNIRVNKKTKHITLETFGSLEKQENKEEFMSMVNKRLLELKEERVQSLNLKINKADNKNSSFINIEQNYGYKILESIYDYLELDKYFGDYQDKLETKIQFKLSEIFKFIVIERILNPDSKRATLQKLNTLYNKKYSFNLDNIYDSLDYYVKIFDEVQIHIRNKINTLIENSSDKIYYDVTNYYTEIDFSDTENDIRQRGVSKEHRVSPIVGLGLFLDSNALPLRVSIFKGDTAETRTLLPGINALRKDYKTGKIICVADKGLNSLENIISIKDNNDGYVFSQIVKGKKGKRYGNYLKDPNTKWNITYKNEDKNIIDYKYTLFEEEVEYTYYEQKENEKRNKVTKTFKQKVLIYYDLKDDIIAKKKRNEKLIKAGLSLTNNSYALTHGFDKYIETYLVDKETGLINDDVKQVKGLNIDKVIDDELYDGYFCIITSELDKDEKWIRDIYHNLWKIEQTFRVTKTDLMFRPIYHFKNEHIVSHFGLCYISLVILRILQYILEKNDISLSAERIIRVLNVMTLKETTEDYFNLNNIGGNLSYKEVFSTTKNKNVQTGIITESDETYQDYLKINKIFKLDLDYSYIAKEKFIKELKKIKISKSIINQKNVNNTIEKNK